ncbi:MAG: UDP-N-acetylmuramate dehydrogenase [Candidatus Roizmanbacteria bacterium]|nr:MAG: UDP-N-acetylmuramate dehydrogenase [Candidatus Roizmanbacteria bacterium]
MKNDLIIKELESIFGKDRIKVDQNLSFYLTLRTQTKAQYYLEAESREDWVKVGQIKASKKIPIFIMGGGSNLAIITDYINGLVVRNLYQKKEVIAETEDYVDLLVSSGYVVARLVIETIKEGWGGLEYHQGLPGTVGGAIFMNSKWAKHHSYFGDQLLYAYLLETNGEIKKVDHDYFKFRYDHSVLQETGEILIEAVFRLKKEMPQVLQKKAQEALNYRSETQPKGIATSGCFFKNISEDIKLRLKLPTTSAGYLIEHAGLKNLRVGDFVVSSMHANFIINEGSGKAEDLIKLLKLIKDKVKEKFGIDLEEEVVVI